MSPHLFKEYWQSTYRIAPISYLFRYAYPQRWWRLHSLPHGQRYAKNAAEMTEILRRHNMILRALFEPGAPFALVIAESSADPWSDTRRQRTMAGYPLLQPFLEIVREEEEEEPQRWQFFFQTMVWQAHITDDILQLVADDEIENVIYVHLTTSRLYLPYDGGADVICASRAERHAMSTQFIAWRPENPEGL